MPGFSIGDNIGQAKSMPSKGDFLRDHRFRLINFMGIAVVDNSMFMQVKDITLPTKDLSTISIKTISTTYDFAAQASYGDLKIMFYGTADLLKRLQEIHNIVHDEEDGLKDFGDYCNIIELELYGPHAKTPSSSLPLIKFSYRNCWIKTLDPGVLTYTSSEIMKIGVVVKTSHYTMEEVQDNKPLTNQPIVTPDRERARGESLRTFN